MKLFRCLNTKAGSGDPTCEPFSLEAARIVTDRYPHTLIVCPSCGCSLVERMDTQTDTRR